MLHLVGNSRPTTYKCGEKGTSREDGSLKQMANYNQRNKTTCCSRPCGMGFPATLARQSLSPLHRPQITEQRQLSPQEDSNRSGGKDPQEKNMIEKSQQGVFPGLKSKKSLQSICERGHGRSTLRSVISLYLHSAPHTATLHL